jgi:hypothetical protein
MTALRDRQGRTRPSLPAGRRDLVPAAREWARWLWTVPRRWYTVGVLTVLVAGLVWGLWPATAPEPPRARQYLAFTGCLLTDEHGITGDDARPVWAGMQDASQATHAKVQFLEVTGPQTGENAATFVASLAQSHCDLIFAAGKVPVDGVHRSAATFPTARFYVVGDREPHQDVSIVDGSSPETIRAAVARILTDAARGQR